MIEKTSFECFGLTNIGNQRKTNEDHFLIAEIAKSMQVLQSSLALDHHTRLFGNTQGIILLVADGMGGHAAGEKASQLVIDGVVEFVLNRLTWLVNEEVLESNHFEEELKRALLACQERIVRDVTDNPQREGMGSTLTLAYIVWPKAFVLHVGDSRCYLLRAGKLGQLTIDHNLANLNQDIDPRRHALDWDSVDQNDDEEDTVLEQPLAHVLWKVVSAEAKHVQPDAFCFDLEPGDRLLLCSDGLYQDLTRKRLTGIMDSDSSAAMICEALVNEALERGGSDNITALVSLCGIRPSSLTPPNIEVALPSANQIGLGKR